MPTTSTWRGSEVTIHSGNFEAVTRHVPSFERRPFAIASPDIVGARENRRLETIVRLPVNGDMSWNIHGASAPGRATKEQQRQAWDYMRDVLRADVILAQEASAPATPSGVPNEWTSVRGERGRFRKNWNWGSVIASKPEFPVRRTKARSRIHGVLSFTTLY